ncbi:hypothetical protein AB0L22_08900 [Micromonospora haikouensis]|uniref:hypothetical protein n=1 Tax=Micromonospora haikouensis TaxID=686309 RepID=UPI003414B584
MTDNAAWLFAQPAYDLRPTLIDWLRANQLDPARIPHDTTITVNRAARTITTDRVVHGDDDKPVMSTTSRNTVACESITVPLLVDPPASIALRLEFTDTPTPEAGR